MIISYRHFQFNANSYYATTFVSFISKLVEA